MNIKNMKGNKLMSLIAFTVIYSVYCDEEISESVKNDKGLTSHVDNEEVRNLKNGAESLNSPLLSDINDSKMPENPFTIKHKRCPSYRLGSSLNTNSFKDDDKKNHKLYETFCRTCVIRNKCDNFQDCPLCEKWCSMSKLCPDTENDKPKLTPDDESPQDERVSLGERANFDGSDDSQQNNNIYTITLNRGTSLMEIILHLLGVWDTKNVEHVIISVETSGNKKLDLNKFMNTTKSADETGDKTLENKLNELKTALNKKLQSSDKGKGLDLNKFHNDLNELLAKIRSREPESLPDSKTRDSKNVEFISRLKDPEPNKPVMHQGFMNPDIIEGTFDPSQITDQKLRHNEDVLGNSASLENPKKSDLARNYESVNNRDLFRSNDVSLGASNPADEHQEKTNTNIRTVEEATSIINKMKNASLKPVSKIMQRLQEQNSEQLGQPKNNESEERKAHVPAHNQHHHHHHNPNEIQDKIHHQIHHEQIVPFRPPPPPPPFWSFPLNPHFRSNEEANMLQQATMPSSSSSGDQLFKNQFDPTLGSLPDTKSQFTSQNNHQFQFLPQDLGNFNPAERSNTVSASDALPDWKNNPSSVPSNLMTQQRNSPYVSSPEYTFPQQYYQRNNIPNDDRFISLDQNTLSQSVAPNLELLKGGTFPSDETNSVNQSPQDILNTKNLNINDIPSGARFRHLKNFPHHQPHRRPPLPPINSHFRNTETENLDPIISRSNLPTDESLNTSDQENEEDPHLPQTQKQDSDSVAKTIDKNVKVLNTGRNAVGPTEGSFENFELDSSSKKNVLGARANNLFKKLKEDTKQRIATQKQQLERARGNVFGSTVQEAQTNFFKKEPKQEAQFFGNSRRTNNNEEDKLGRLVEPEQTSVNKVDHQLFSKNGADILGSQPLEGSFERTQLLTKPYDQTKLTNMRKDAQVGASNPDFDNRANFESMEVGFNSLGQIIPGSNEVDISLKKFSDVYFVGNGIKLPLQMVKNSDGSVHFSVDIDKLCSCNNMTCPKNRTAKELEATVETILEKEAELKKQLLNDKSPKSGFSYDSIFHRDNSRNQREFSDPFLEMKNSIANSKFDLNDHNLKKKRSIDDYSSKLKANTETKALINQLVYNAKNKENINWSDEQQKIRTFLQDVGQELKKTLTKNINNQKSSKQNTNRNIGNLIPITRKYKFKGLEEELARKIHNINTSVDNYSKIDDKIFENESTVLSKLTENPLIRQEVGIVSRLLAFFKKIAVEEATHKKE